MQNQHVTVTTGSRPQHIDGHHTKYDAKSCLFKTKKKYNTNKSWDPVRKLREREPEGGSTYIGCTHSFMQVPAITPQEAAIYMADTYNGQTTIYIDT